MVVQRHRLRQCHLVGQAPYHCQDQNGAVWSLGHNSCKWPKNVWFCMGHFQVAKNVRLRNCPPLSKKSRIWSLPATLKKISRYDDVGSFVSSPISKGGQRKALWSHGYSWGQIIPGFVISCLMQILVIQIDLQMSAHNLTSWNVNKNWHLRIHFPFVAEMWKSFENTPWHLLQRYF